MNINKLGRTPIYMQIIDEIEKEILAGILKPMDQLPSVRALSVEISINPNTIQKAYTELEHKGICYTSPGQGISAAVGMAMAAKYQGKTNRVYSLLGDGEIQEGQVWEACMAAAHYKLDNLCIVVDNNGLQIDGNVADVMSPYPIVDKLLAFGFNVHAVDGHDFEALEKAFENAKKTKGQPTAIVMTTVKGKGVSYMENDAGWHGKAPNDAEYEQAMNELKAQLAELEGK